MNPDIEYLLSGLRCGSARAKLWQLEIDSIGVALKGGLINYDAAQKWIDDCGAKFLVEAPVPVSAQNAPKLREPVGGAA